MMILSTLLEATGTILHMVINVYIWIIIIASLLTWVRPDPFNPIVQTLNRLTEPVFIAVRKRIRTYFGGIDLAPVIILLILQFIDLFFVKSMFEIASSI